MLRYFSGGILLAAAVATAGSSPAVADVTISTDATQNMSCAAGVCTPIAATAVLNVSDLESLLASGNVKVTTTGSGTQATDIKVAANLTWSGGTSLTLDAYRSVNVDNSVRVKGMGGVTVLTDDGGSRGEFVLGPRGSLAFANLSGSLSINGTSFALVSSVVSLAGAIAANPAGAYALANSYDAGQDGTYAASPVSTVFTGNFNGLGNTIYNLTINDPTENSYVGLFAETSASASLASIRLANENVTGSSGTDDESSTEFVGGVVGYADGGTISNVAADGVVAAGQFASAGGLAGIGDVAISASSAATNVSNGGAGNAGGIIGGTNAGASIADTKSTGSVSGGGFIGGLVGISYNSSINRSSASGEVTGTDDKTYAGGLVGLNNFAQVLGSAATGPVTCRLVCGGLAGMNQGDGTNHLIVESYATGNVTANACAGGLVGNTSAGSISNSYATGSVSAPQAGGLVCQNTEPEGYIGVERSYSAGAVTGNSGMTGGLIGNDQFSGSLRHDYWDMTTSGITDRSQGAGNIANDPGIKGLSNTKLQSGLPKGFSPRVWTEAPNVNGGLPYLIDNPPPK